MGERVEPWLRWSLGRWWRLSLLAPVGLAAWSFAIAAMSGRWEEVFTYEGDFIELSQVSLWGIGIGLAAWLGVRTQGRARGAVAWRGLIAMVALGRELDLQEMLNPEVLGGLGVRYRFDWWTDLSVPLLQKLMWVVIAAGVIVAFTAAVRRARPSTRQQLTCGHPAAWLTLLAVGFLGSGWVLDDLLRGMLPKVPAMTAEELGELMGAGLFMASIVASGTEPWAIWRRRVRLWRSAADGESPTGC